MIGLFETSLTSALKTVQVPFQVPSVPELRDQPPHIRQL
jgi:hypothetical protein